MNLSVVSSIRSAGASPEYFADALKGSPFVFEPSAERYADSTPMPIKRVRDAPLSTFSIDVDTGSYAQWHSLKRCDDFLARLNRWPGWLLS